MENMIRGAPLFCCMYYFSVVSYVLIVVAFECMRVVAQHGFGMMRLAICFALKLDAIAAEL